MAGDKGQKRKLPSGSPEQLKPNADDAARSNSEKSQKDVADPENAIPPYGYLTSDKKGGLCFKTMSSAVSKTVPEDLLQAMKEKYADTFLRYRQDESQKNGWALNMLELFHLYGAAYGFDSESMARNMNFAPGFLKNDIQFPKRIATQGSYHRIKERIFKLIKCYGSYTEMFPFMNMPGSTAQRVQDIIKSLENKEYVASEKEKMDQLEELTGLMNGQKDTLRLSELEDAMQNHRNGQHDVVFLDGDVAKSFANFLAIASCRDCVESFCELRIECSASSEMKDVSQKLESIRAVGQAFLDSSVGYYHPNIISDWNCSPMNCEQFSFNLCDPELLFRIDGRPSSSVSVAEVLNVKPTSVTNEEAQNTEISVGTASERSMESFRTIDSYSENPPSN